jgi:hypothetical protein
LLGVILAALVMACSKSLSPKVEGDGTRAGGGVTDPLWTSPTLPEPQTARARLRFVATELRLDDAFRVHERHNVEYLIDVHDPAPAVFLPPDTVPANALLKQVRWRMPEGPGPDYVVDNEPVFTSNPPIPDSLAGRIPAGDFHLTVPAPERAGGQGVAFRIHGNFAPDLVWWAGPDPSRFPPSSDGDGRAVDVLDGASFSTSPAWPPDGRGYFGPDSFAQVPHERLPVNGDLQTRTFYEIWDGRIYARSEGDVVHEGAFVVLMLGGFDRDSPYNPPVELGAPTLPVGWETQPQLYPLLHDQGLNGSPIGFRHVVPIKRPDGTVLRPALTATHPNFMPSSVFYNPKVANYVFTFATGKYYAVGFPVDGHGQLDPSFRIDWVALADRVDAGLGTPEEQALRRRVLTFEVQGAPAARAARSAAAGAAPRTERSRN